MLVPEQQGDVGRRARGERRHGVELELYRQPGVGHQGRCDQCQHGTGGAAQRLGLGLLQEPRRAWITLQRHLDRLGQALAHELRAARAPGHVARAERPTERSGGRVGRQHQSVPRHAAAGRGHPVLAARRVAASLLPTDDLARGASNRLLRRQHDDRRRRRHDLGLGDARQHQGRHHRQSQRHLRRRAADHKCQPVLGDVASQWRSLDLQGRVVLCRSGTSVTVRLPCNHHELDALLRLHTGLDRYRCRRSMG